MKDKKDMYLWLQVGEDVTDSDIRSALYDKGITRCILHPLPEYDWSSFRREAAKEILAGTIASGKAYTSLDKTGIVNFVLDYTDELIRQLKQE